MLTHHPNVSRVLWHVRIVFNRESAFLVVEIASNEEGNEPNFDHTADQRRYLEFIAFGYDGDDTYCPIRCDASLCDYLYTIPSHHSTCEDPLWKSRF